jgi:integrase/recombinase XerD
MKRNSTSVSRIRRRGRWVYVIDFEYFDNSGRLQRYRRNAAIQSATGAKAEAERLKMRAVSSGSLKTRERAPLLKDFVQGLFELLYMPKYRPSTLVRYRALLRQSILPAFGSTHVDDIDAMLVRAFAAKLMIKGVQVKGHVALMKTLLRAAFETGLITQLPSIPRLYAESHKVVDVPSREEATALLARAEGWLRVCLALALLAGLRMGECRAFEVQDIDFDQNVLHVRRALSEDQECTPKSGHERTIPMTPQLVEILRGAVKDKLPKARLVTNCHGLTPKRQLVLTRFVQLQRRCGFPSRSFHSTRHYFLSELVRYGASLEAVRLIAGHSKLEITQKYVHARAEDLHAAVAKLPKTS